jgi:hypothetical protein
VVSLNRKHLPWLKILASDKHFSVFRHSVNDGEKKFLKNCEMASLTLKFVSGKDGENFHPSNQTMKTRVQSLRA